MATREVELNDQIKKYNEELEDAKQEYFDATKKLAKLKN